MVASTQVLQVPYDPKIVDENGNVTQPWIDFFSIIVDRLDALDTSLASQGVTLASQGVTVASHGVDIGFLETAAGDMDVLTSTSTATDMINAWEEFRVGLANI